MEQALSLPEIRNLIGSFLSHRNRQTCALLSRAWAESITPWIWYSVTIIKMPSPEKLAVLHKYRNFVRTLTIRECRVLKNIHKWFENLRGLHFQYLNDSGDSQGLSVELIRRNQSSLRKMIATFFGSDYSNILKTALECHSLKHLHHRKFKIQDRDMMESFIKTCTQLTTLHLEESSFLEGTHLMLRGQMFVNLEKVQLRFIQGPYLDFLKACPNLKALTVFQVDFISAEIFFETISTHCRKLCVLHCGSCGFDSDREFEPLALALPPMKCLQLMRDVNPKFLLNSVFSCHYETLQMVQILDVCDSNIIQTILCSCPNLRSFFGEYIDAKVIESGSPWVCKRLEFLQLEIVVPFDDDHLHSVACGQLSQLKELRALNLNVSWWSPPYRPNGRALSLRMGEGLELLGSLKKLEHFGMGPLRAEWQDEDIKWMAQTWPDLECIYGGYADAEEDDIFPWMCEQLGVSFVRKMFPFFDDIGFIEL